MSDNDLLNVTFHVNVVPSGPHKFEGFFGPNEFVAGRSVKEVSLREALRLGASLELQDDTGMQVSTINFEALIAKHAKAPEPVVVAEPEPVVVVVPLPETPVKVSRIYSQEELEQIADKKGITGLREVADLMNVKGRSIPEMIQLIVAKQRSG